MIGNGSSPPTVASSGDVAASRGLLCPSCGQTAPEGHQYCPFDGEPLITEKLSRARPDPLLGVTVDERYEVLAVIGEGGMGRVYRVRHRRLGRSFALKALRLELARELSLAERFIQEARAAAVVTHPNVVQINDFGTLHTGQPYFVMELLEGRTLARIIREEGPLDPLRCLTIARQIAEAISAAHAMGVIHRDLKPDNVILVRPSGSHATVKVLDFGLAKVAGSNRLTRPGVVFGTPQYMSPEQASGEPFDHRVDVYALGIIMFEMLTGHVPFEADTQMGILSKHLYQDPPRLPELNLPVVAQPRLQEAIARCLAKRAEDRWSSMTELARRLDWLCREAAKQEAAATSGIPFGPVEPLPSAQPARQRRLRWFVAGATFFFLGFLAFAWFTRRAGISAVTPAPVAGGALPDDTATDVAAPPTAQPSRTTAATEPRLAPHPDTTESASASPAVSPRLAAPLSSTPRPGRRESAIAPKSSKKPGFGAGEIADPWAK